MRAHISERRAQRLGDGIQRIVLRDQLLHQVFQPQERTHPAARERRDIRIWHEQFSRRISLVDQQRLDVARLEKCTDQVVGLVATRASSTADSVASQPKNVASSRISR